MKNSGCLIALVLLFLVALKALPADGFFGGFTFIVLAGIVFLFFELLTERDD